MLLSRVSVPSTVPVSDYLSAATRDATGPITRPSGDEQVVNEGSEEASAASVLHQQLVAASVLDSCSSDGQTALHIVAQAGQLALVDALITAGASVNVRLRMCATFVPCPLLKQAET